MALGVLGTQTFWKKNRGVYGRGKRGICCKLTEVEKMRGLLQDTSAVNGMEQLRGKGETLGVVGKQSNTW